MKAVSGNFNTAKQRKKQASQQVILLDWCYLLWLRTKAQNSFWNKRTHKPARIRSTKGRWRIAFFKSPRDRQPHIYFCSNACIAPKTKMPSSDRMHRDVERNLQLSGGWFNEMANFAPRWMKLDSKFKYLYLKYHQACGDSTLNLPEKPATCEFEVF